MFDCILNTPLVNILILIRYHSCSSFIFSIVISAALALSFKIGIYNYSSFNFQDQVYSNTQVPTQSRESTRINASLTRINTNQHESDTSQHEFDMSHHESNTNQHESDTNQLESTQVKKCPSLVNMSQRKSDTSLTQVNLS